jgi:hypothetical protein
MTTIAQMHGGSMQCFVACVAMAFLSACSSPSSEHAGLPCVRKMDNSATPQTRVFARRARQTGDQMYPGVCALLAEGDWDFPSNLDIRFKKNLPRMHTGEPRPRQIRPH